MAMCLSGKKSSFEHARNFDIGNCAGVDLFALIRFRIAAVDELRNNETRCKNFCLYYEGSF